MDPTLPATAWDQAVASALRQQTQAPTTPARDGRAALLPRPTGRGPVRPPRLARTVAQIDPDLRQTLRGLVSGELPWPLVLLGEPGRGKTCAAGCLLDFSGGDYHTVAGLCALLIQSQQGRLERTHEGRGGVVWPEQLWGRIAAAPLAVLDELGGRDKVSDAHYEAVRQFLEERLHRPCVVISNHPLLVIAKLYDARVASRLAAGTVVLLEGRDRRLDP